MEKRKLEDYIGVLRDNLKNLNQNYYELEKFRKVKIVNLPNLKTNKTQTFESSDEATPFKLKFKTEIGKLAINFQDSIEDEIHKKPCLSSTRKANNPCILINPKETEKSLANVVDNLFLKEKKNCKTEFSTADLTVHNIKSMSIEKSICNTEQTNREKTSKLESSHKIKEIETKQEKICKFIDTQLSSSLVSNDQKKYYLVEKAIRVGIQENEEKQLNFKVIDNYIHSKQKLNPKSVEIIKQITEMENKLKKIDMIIAQLKSNEMERISKEFLYYDYLRRFNTDKKTVICALIGEESLYDELLREDRERNVSSLNN